ncbi:MAG: hypothetical protein ACJAVV_003665 [Alphaproteobacteria bacterium]|jgi:hypothetical protein
MTLRSLIKVVSVAALFTIASASQAAIIASTDFDGRTVSGASASDLNWVVNGVEAQGDLNADESTTITPQIGLFDTANSKDMFAVSTC